MRLQRPNFYELLELDATIVDWSSIEPRLNQKISIWEKARLEGNPAQRRDALENLNLVESIRSTLQDSEACLKESQAYQQQQISINEKNNEKLKRQIDLMIASGATCQQDQFNQWSTLWDGVYTQDYLKEQLQLNSVNIVENQQQSPSSHTQQKLQDHVSQAVAQRLSVLGLVNLYEFLKMSDKTPAAQLKANAGKLYQSYGAMIKSPENEARKQLAGLCQTIFRSEKDKQKYDRYLKLLPLSELKAELELAAMSQPIRLATVKYLVDQAQLLNISDAQMRQHLLALGAEQGWRFDQSSIEYLTDKALLAKQSQDGSGDNAVIAGALGASTGGSNNQAESEAEVDTNHLQYPPAPASLNVSQVDTGYSLSWPRARALGKIEYRVVRCQDSVPHNSLSGELVGLTGTTSINDANVVPDKKWYYGVFTVRDDLSSIDCAYSGPHHIISIKRNFSWLKTVAASFLLLTFFGAGAWALNYNYQLNSEVLVQAAQVQTSSEQAKISADKAQQLARQLQSKVRDINSIDSAKTAIEQAEQAVKIATQAADEAAIAALRSQNQLQKTENAYAKILVPVGETDASYDGAIQWENEAQKSASFAKTAKEIANESLSDAKVRLDQLIEEQRQQQRLLAQQQAEQARLAKLERDRRIRDAAMRRQKDAALYAEVVQVIPITVKIPREECKVTRKKPSSLGKIFGAIVGGVIGANSNSNSGAQAGVLGGVIVGEEVDKKIDRANSKEECFTVDELVDLFEVQYQYQGQQEYARLEYNPGGRGTKVEIDEIRRAAQEAEDALKQ